MNDKWKCIAREIDATNFNGNTYAPLKWFFMSGRNNHRIQDMAPGVFNMSMLISNIEFPAHMRAVKGFLW